MKHDSRAPALAYGPPTAAPTLHEAVGRVVEQWPEAIALSTADTSYTYSEVWRAALSWSGLLAEHGVVEGDVVVITAKREPALIAALLGVLVRGAVYSVVDPSWPEDRQQTLVERLRPRLGIGFAPDRFDFTCLPLHDVGRVPVHPPVHGDVAPDGAACVFWTSGSTGQPKAVVATHQANSRLFTGTAPVPVGPGHALPALAAVAWDGFALEVWSQLLAGGHLMLHGADYFLPGDAREAVRAGATDLFMTAGLFDIFVVEDLECFAGLGSVWVGGDKLSTESSARFVERYPNVPLINIYGPVECGIFIASRRVEPGDVASGDIPVGSLSPGVTVAVVDAGEVVTGQEVGEIYASGPPVALGYHGDERATAAAFVGAPSGASAEQAGARWYRTGDLGFLDEEHVLHFRGRADRQIKVGGHRIEPAEIEAAAIAAGCRYACVVARTQDDTVTGVAMAAVTSGPMEASQLRDRLAETLLPQMVPWPIVLVEALPLTGNGKVDRDRVADLVEAGGT